MASQIMKRSDTKCSYRCWNMLSVQWYDVAEGVGAIATGVGVLVAAGALTLQLRDRRRTSARDVSVWMDLAIDLDPTTADVEIAASEFILVWRVVVANWGREPVTEVVVGTKIRGKYREWTTFGYIAPRHKRTGLISVGATEMHHEHSEGVFVDFLDCSGRGWRREPYSALDRVYRFYWPRRFRPKFGEKKVPTKMEPLD